MTFADKAQQILDGDFGTCPYCHHPVADHDWDGGPFCTAKGCKCYKNLIGPTQNEKLAQLTAAHEEALIEELLKELEAVLGITQWGVVDANETLVARIDHYKAKRKKGQEK